MPSVPLMATAFIHWPCASLTDNLVRKALKSSFVVTSTIPDSYTKLLQWATYDSIDHDLTLSNPISVLSSSYTFRKALIRKHFLSRCIHSYTTKHADSTLKNAVPRTWEMEISFADELDEMWTDELWELGNELETKPKWWILKPGMADRGLGIRMFNSKEALEKIFEEFEGNSDEEQEEVDDTAVIAYQLKHFIVQEYLSSPLLLDPLQVPIKQDSKPKPNDLLQGHKFHLRTYCVASGALALYLYPRVLALFSSSPYYLPDPEDGDDPIDLTPHLTNTSLQTHRGEDGVRLLDELVGCHILSSTKEGATISKSHITSIVDQIADILSETFKAALETSVHFQPLPNSFELYGVDFLVTHNPNPTASTPFQVKLLELNAEPAIELTGPRLTWILEDLFKSIAKVCVEPFLDAQKETLSDWSVGETRHGLRKCLDVQVRGSGSW